MEREYYDEKSAARILNIHFDSLRRLRRRGMITHYKSATGRISYKIDDLMTFSLRYRIESVTQPVPSLPEKPLLAGAAVHSFPLVATAAR